MLKVTIQFDWVLALCLFILGAIYLGFGICIWKEWNYTFPSMKWSKSKWRWIWFPAYKSAEFVFYVFLWPVAMVMGIIFALYITISTFFDWLKQRRAI